MLFKFFWPKTHVKFSKTTVFCTSKSQKLRFLSSIVHRPRLLQNVYKIQSIVHRVFTLDRPYTLFVQYSSKVRPSLRYGNGENKGVALTVQSCYPTTWGGCSELVDSSDKTIRPFGMADSNVCLFKKYSGYNMLFHFAR